LLSTGAVGQEPLDLGFGTHLSTALWRHQRAAAKEWKEIEMRRMMGFSLGCVGFIASVMFIVWIMGAFEGSNLGTHGWIAFTLGVVITCALGIGLMALVFYSDRSGQDDRAGGGGDNRSR
jgi:hypothetical protein